MSKVLVTFLALAFSAPAALAVSFDCAKATTFVEKEICADALLGKLDDALSDNYRGMYNSNIGGGARKELKATQRAWLVERNKCTTKKCVVDAYRKRVDEVCEYPVLSGIHPGCTSADEVK